jgi:hypothetical protein
MSYDLEAAAAEFPAVMQRIERALGPSAPLTLLAKARLARLHTRSGRFDEAEEALRRVVPRLEQVLGPEHAHTLEARFNLASCLGSFPDGKTESAKLHRELAPVLRRVLGERDGLTLATEFNLGSFAAERGELECALYHLQRAFEGGFFFMGRRPDGTTYSWEGIAEDPSMHNLIGHPGFERLFRNGGYMAHVSLACATADFATIRSEIEAAIAGGLGYVEWLADYECFDKWREEDPLAATVLARAKPAVNPCVPDPAD